MIWKGVRCTRAELILFGYIYNHSFTVGMYAYLHLGQKKKNRATHDSRNPYIKGSEAHTDPNAIR